jgi:hypothetical protein
MRAASAKVSEEDGFGTPEIFQGIGQDGQAFESIILVDGCGKSDDGCRQPAMVQLDFVEDVPECVTEQSGLCHSFAFTDGPVVAPVLPAE